MASKQAERTEAPAISNVPARTRQAGVSRSAQQSASPRLANKPTGAEAPPGQSVGTMPPLPRRRRRLYDDDAIWDIVGMSSADDGPNDVSEHKHRYLAEAYTPTNE